MIPGFQLGIGRFGDEWELQAYAMIWESFCDALTRERVSVGSVLVLLGRSRIVRIMQCI